MSLTIFYDSQCPLCMAEMQQLGEHDQQGQLQLVDLHGDGFEQRYPHIDKTAAMAILHAETEDGEILLGLDVTHRAWSLVGKHKWLAMLRWPLIKTIADVVYRLFARHRNRVSYLLMGQSRCRGSCGLETGSSAKDG